VVEGLEPLVLGFHLILSKWLESDVYLVLTISIWFFSLRIIVISIRIVSEGNAAPSTAFERLDKQVFIGEQIEL
jgi:hypothetical protein